MGLRKFDVHELVDEVSLSIVEKVSHHTWKLGTLRHQRTIALVHALAATIMQC
jgi:hypothetical protein